MVLLLSIHSPRRGEPVVYRFGLVGLDAPGVGRGATGRLFTFELLPGELLPGRELEFRESLRFTLARGMSTSIDLFAFTERLLFAFLLAFLLLLALLLSFAFFGLGRLGLFSLPEFALRFSAALSSAGGTVSGDSPSFVGRLMSIATVWPVFTTSSARGNWKRTVLGFASLLGREARTRNLRSASASICSASNRSLPTTFGTFTSGLRKDR
jgi:hypothetical protein